MWDFEKFYDTISIDKLISKCNELRYPVKLTALGLMIHTAPRMLKAYDHYAMVGIPANGIIAGCTQSNHFARIFLHDIVRDTLSGSPFNYIRYEYWNDIRTFVDDVSQTVRSMQPITKLMQAARVLIQRAKHNHLIISPKTVVLASKKEYADKIVYNLAVHGVSTKHVHAAKDLGVGRSLGWRKCTFALTKRITATVGRVRRIKVLRKTKA